MSSNWKTVQKDTRDWTLRSGSSVTTSFTEWEWKGCRATYFELKNTSVVGHNRMGHFWDMKTVSITEMETVDQQEQPKRTGKKALAIHWEDSEWFKVWLELAREERTPAPAVC